MSRKHLENDKLIMARSVVTEVSPSLARETEEGAIPNHLPNPTVETFAT